MCPINEARARVHTHKLTSQNLWKFARKLNPLERKKKPPVSPSFGKFYAGERRFLSSRAQLVRDDAIPSRNRSTKGHTLYRLVATVIIW